MLIPKPREQQRNTYRPRKDGYCHPRQNDLIYIFGVDKVWAVNRKMRFTKQLLTYYSSLQDHFVKLRLKSAPGEKWVSDLYLTELAQIINKLNKEISYLKKYKRYLRANKEYKNNKDNKDNKKYPPRPQIDIDDLKEQVPIRDVLTRAGIHVYRNNFFKLRNERTPSAQFNEDKNIWHDFGSGRGGSVIDLYCQIHNVSVGEAIKELSFYL